MRNRTFYFGSYNGLRQTTTVYKNDARVPFSLERAGDFSQSATKPRDPVTGLPFPGDRIPASRFDPAALRIMNDYVPLANLPNNLYEVQEPKPERRNEITLKLDHELAAGHRLSGSYFLSRGRMVEVLRGTLPGPNRQFEWNQQNYIATDTWAMRSGVVVPRGIAPPDRNNFAPRLGVAWDVFGDGRTAARAALGVFYGTISGNMWNATADGQPFSIRQQFNTPGTLSDPYSTLPGGSPFPYEYSPTSPRFVFPAGLQGLSLDFRMAYTYQTNVAIQRQLADDLSATVAYVGARGHNLPLGNQVNYPVPGTGNIETRRPYLPGRLGSIIVIESAMGNQYDGMQITVDKRMSKSFQAAGSYVFAKSLEDIDMQTTSAGARRTSTISRPSVGGQTTTGRTSPGFPRSGDPTSPSVRGCYASWLTTGRSRP